MKLFKVHVRLDNTKPCYYDIVERDLTISITLLPFEYKTYYFYLFIFILKVFSRINYDSFIILKITKKIRGQSENKNHVKLTFK